jgi:hypothetical protein
VSGRVRRIVMRDGYDDELSISRDAGGRLSILHLRLLKKWADLVAPAIESLPPGSVTELRVETTRALDRDWAARLQAACERLKPGILELPDQ